MARRESGGGTKQQEARRPVVILADERRAEESARGSESRNRHVDVYAHCQAGPLIRASDSAVVRILHTVSHELSAQAMASKEARLRAISLYKELHRLGREYPDPAYVLFLWSHTTKSL